MEIVDAHTVTDETRVGGMPWRELKSANTKESWFDQLSDKEKVVLKKLVKA